MATPRQNMGLVVPLFLLSAFTEAAWFGGVVMNSLFVAFVPCCSNFRFLFSSFRMLCPSVLSVPSLVDPLVAAALRSFLCG
jgi:hypothetical protein